MPGGRTTPPTFFLRDERDGELDAAELGSRPQREEEEGHERADGRRQRVRCERRSRVEADGSD
jgi:hypothetical protein